MIKKWKKLMRKNAPHNFPGVTSSNCLTWPTNTPKTAKDYLFTVINYKDGQQKKLENGKCLSLKNDWNDYQNSWQLVFLQSTNWLFDELLQLYIFFSN